MPGHSRQTIDCDYLYPRYAAAYLRIAGDEAAFIEANTGHAAPRLLDTLARSALRPEQVRWVIVTHVHLDHAGGASALMRACPNATLLAHPRAVRHLVDPSKLVASATAVYGAERFRELYGNVDPIDAARVRALDDGESVALGDCDLRFVHTRGHANHHFVVHDPALDAVFTGDAFGLSYPALQRAGRFAFPSTSPTDFDPVEARLSLDRILALGVSVACLTHFGEVGDLAATAADLRSWLDASEEWLDQATASSAPREATKGVIESAIRGRMEREASARGLLLGPDEWAMLQTDIDLNAQGIAFVASRRREKRTSA